MLLVGDVHINAKQSFAILQSLRDFVAHFPDEKDILFLGDYMYMFSYDRQALADLFDFFLEVWNQGKSVYIMAGNHDWLNQHFIYHEGKKIADILNTHTKDNKIHFITQPETHEIQGEKYFFLPYNKQFLFDTLNSLNKHTPPEQFETTQGTTDIYAEATALLESKNTNEQLSGALNIYLLNNLEVVQNATLIHHYYTAKTSFPGQFAKFDYKDISLHPMWMQILPKVISGHLHKAFVHQNYFCTGSVWHTSSTEREQRKWFWRYSPSSLSSSNTSTNNREGRPVAIKPYVTIDDTKQISEKAIHEVVSSIYKNHTTLLTENNTYNFTIPTTPTYAIAATTLIVYTNKDIADLEALVDPTIKDAIGDIQHKQTLKNNTDMTELLDISQYNIQQSLLDWKELVKKYILSRCGEESEKYRTLLSELNIL